MNKLHNNAEQKRQSGYCFGIADIELMPLKELRKSMARYGIRAADNEFSGSIIEEREK